MLNLRKRIACLKMLKQLKMLILINILIQDMELDLILVHFFQFQILIKNAIIFRVDMSSSVHIDNRNKDILILGEGPTQGLDDTILAAEAEYSINF